MKELIFFTDGATPNNQNKGNRKGGVGVFFGDNDPRNISFGLVESDKLVKLTSDDFFKSNKETFDVIFIDGMHQTEYVLNDFNNSVKCLNDNGKIFIDATFAPVSIPAFAPAPVAPPRTKE